MGRRGGGEGQPAAAMEKTGSGDVDGGGAEEEES